MSKTAVSYLRVSGAGQVQGDGFPRQRAAIEGYAKSHRIEVVAEFRDEGVSGTRELEDREGLAELIARLKRGDVDLVLVENASRLARDLMVGEIILREIAKLGIPVIAADSGTDLSAGNGDPTRRLIRQVLGAVAEFEKSALVAKLAAARRRARMARGRCEGPKPFGELEGEQEALRDLLRLARRRNGRRLSAAAIARAMDELGHKPRHGERWSRSTVRAILRRKRPQ